MHCHQVGKFQRQTTPLSSSKVQKFNIVAVSVCPGLYRSDAIALLLNTAHGWNRSTFVYDRRCSVGFLASFQYLDTNDSSGTSSFDYLHILTKFMTYAMQPMLHVPFSQRFSRAMPAKVQMLQKNFSRQTYSTASVQLLTEPCNGCHCRRISIGCEGALKEWEK
ncbi:hypothetical protein BDR07DRAFT_625142 [Suillus spraguei]|nr:hypothetical protein BDR07DRAFT_625142 [Suillus spraguei]